MTSYTLRPDTFTLNFNVTLSGTARVMYLEADPTIMCWEGSHTTWAYLLGLPMLIVYGVGIPFGAFIILYWRRKKLDEDRCRVVYGFMYSNFKLDYYFWDCMVYSRKAAFAMAGTLLRPSGAELQCAAGILILFLAHFAHLKWQPYIEERLNRAEARSLLVSMATLFAGLALMSPQSSENFKVLLTLLIFVLNVALFLYMSWLLYVALNYIIFSVAKYLH
jgi:hypothetical protein